MFNDSDNTKPKVKPVEMRSDYQRANSDLTEITATGTDAKKIEAEKVADSLYQQLPEIAKSLISECQDLSIPQNQSFALEPDDSSEHEPNWHQWGIITHTRKFGQVYQNEIPSYLAEWGIRDKVSQEMAQEIDGLPKQQLIQVAIPLHDLGKFIDRKTTTEQDGKIRHSMRGHEETSGKIIRSPWISKTLKENGLTDLQVEYVARCAELHYELGVLRNSAKETPEGYSIAFTQTELFKTLVQQIIQQHPDFQVEVGLLFLGDSLSKTDVKIDAENDQEIIDQAPAGKAIIKDRGLNPSLIGAVNQLPVNLAVAKKYFQIWSEQNNHVSELSQ